MLSLGTAVELLSPFIGANQDAAQRINLVDERYLKSSDPVGSLELVAITVATDANGEGFIELPERYSAIRGAVETNIADSKCAWPLEMRNRWYEYAPGNIGMIKGSDALRGVIPITNAEGETTRKYKVPVCPSVGSNTYFTCICKIAFVMLEDDDDILPVQNLGALKLGLKALDKEDAEDYARAKELWAQGKNLLCEETENESGPEALGKVQMDDDFQLGAMSLEEGYGNYGYW